MIGSEGVRAALRAIGAEAQRRAVPVMLLLGWGGRDQDVTQWARTEGLIVIDIWPAVQRRLAETGRDFQSLWVAAPVDNHPNEEGHAIIGRLLAERVLEQGPRPPWGRAPDTGPA